MQKESSHMKIYPIIFIISLFLLNGCNSSNIYRIDNNLNLEQNAIDDLMKYDIIAIGEVHGTNEIPNATVFITYHTKTFFLPSTGIQVPRITVKPFGDAFVLCGTNCPHL